MARGDPCQLQSKKACSTTPLEALGACLTCSRALASLSHDDELPTEVTESSGHKASLLKAMGHVDLEALLQILQENRNALVGVQGHGCDERPRPGHIC